MRLLCVITLSLFAATACGGEADQLGDPASTSPSQSTSAPAPTAHATVAPEPDTASPTTNDDLDSLRFTASFGSCLGYCIDTLTFRGQSVFLTSETRESSEGDVISEGTIDAATITSLAEEARKLQETQLAEVYGCPDCADGGASSITLNGSSHTYEFANPPAEFVTLDGLVMSLRDALRSCDSNDLISVKAGCTPTDGS